MTEDLRRWRLSSVFVGPIFQIFPLTVNQRPDTITLLPSGLVYLLLCFLCEVSIHNLLRLFYVCPLLKRKNWCLWKISASFSHTIYSWRSIVTCNRCSIVSSHKCLTRTNQTFCTISFNRKLRKYFETERPCLFYFCVDVARILKLARY